MTTTKIINVLFNTKNNPAGAQGVVTALQRIEQQAQRTKQTMREIGQVGNTMMMAGSAILAPLILSAKKYVDTMKETEPTSARMVALSKRWEESQVKIGRVVSREILPALEKGLDILDKIVAWSEENPGAIGAALNIGGSLVVLGGIVSTVAKIIGAVATVQGVLSGLGIGAGAATTATATTAAGGITLAGIGSTILAVLTNPLTWAVAGLFLIKPVMNWAMGTNQTWADIGLTAKRILILAGMGLDGIKTTLVDLFTGLWMNITQIIEKLGAMASENINYAVTQISRFFSGLVNSLYNTGRNIITGIGNYISNLASSIGNWFSALGDKILAGIQKIVDWVKSVIPGLASGGMVGSGIVRVGERGREFILSHNTTRAAEQMIGGTLTQQNFLRALSRGVNVNQNMRFSGDIGVADKRQIQRMARQAAFDGMMGALT